MLLSPCEFNIDECIDKLSNIPELESSLLKILNCNSKLNREILTLKDAVLYLGAKNTRIIAIACITKLLLPNKKDRGLNYSTIKHTGNIVSVLQSQAI